MKEEEPFSQLYLKFTDPIQYDYEVIRPIMLYSETVAARSQETETPRTTVSERPKDSSKGECWDWSINGHSLHSQGKSATQIQLQNISYI